MDNKRFDDLTLGIAQGISRRDALKLFVAAIAGIGASSILKLDGEELSNRTQTAAAQVICQPTNDVSIPCEQYYEYVKACGVICPSGTRLYGADGCTDYKMDFLPQNRLTVPTINAGGVPKHDKVNKQWCVEATITWPIYWKLPPVSDMMRFTPSETPCCGPECFQDVATLWASIEEHEKAHRDNVIAYFDHLQEEWTEKRFGYTPDAKICGKNPKEAEFLLWETVRQEQFKSKQALDQVGHTEPPYGHIIECNFCRAPENNEVCCFGQCQRFDACQPCAKPCGEKCCEPCQECLDASRSICVSKTCPDCTECNQITDTCDPVDCGECSRCENSTCLPCADGQKCCGGQCINADQQCCGNIATGQEWACNFYNETCCSNGTCCDATSTCCPQPDGTQACVRVGNDNCNFQCTPCLSDQTCCVSAWNSSFGCCTATEMCDPFHGCVAKPV